MTPGAPATSLRGQTRSGEGKVLRDPVRVETEGKGLVEGGDGWGSGVGNGGAEGGEEVVGGPECWGGQRPPSRWTGQTLRGF